MSSKDGIKCSNLIGTFDCYDMNYEEEGNVVWKGYSIADHSNLPVESEMFIPEETSFQTTDSLLPLPSSAYFQEHDDPQFMNQALRADDAYFDSNTIDFNSLLSKSERSKKVIDSRSSETTEERMDWSHRIGSKYSDSSAESSPYEAALESSPLYSDEETEDEKPREVCKYWLSGNCIYGDKCWYAHERNPQPKSKTPTIDEYTGICCICQEDVKASGKRFGLMQNCSHIFCLDCIRNWRYSHCGDPNVRRCPLCRSTSFYIIPCNEPVVDYNMKKRIINTYKQNMSQIPCKYFNGGKGQCPFGDCCFYSHVLDNGQKYESRMVMQPDGELKDIGCSLCLGDCFIRKTKQKKDRKKKKAKREIDGEY